MRLMPYKTDYTSAKDVLEAFHANEWFIVNDATTVIEVRRKKIDVCWEGQKVRKSMLTLWKVLWVTLRYCGLTKETNLEVTSRESMTQELSDTLRCGWMESEVGLRSRCERGDKDEVITERGEV
jgi:hypothetical protein